ncbi:MAG: hypothetical protein ACXVAU_06680 [Mucilaginibacter sp.]
MIHRAVKSYPGKTLQHKPSFKTSNDRQKPTFQVQLSVLVLSVYIWSKQFNTTFKYADRNYIPEGEAMATKKRESGRVE